MWKLVIVVPALFACGGGGASACDHTQGSSTCCETQADCTVGTCSPPGSFAGCGACNPDPGTCTDDTGCTNGMICEPIQCACQGGRTCVPGCTSDESCELGSVCDVAGTHRCTPKPCGGDGDCPADFACPAGTCTRKACTDSGDCAGFCVVGACFATAGACLLAPP